MPEKQELSFIFVIKAFSKWRKHIIGTTLGVTVITAVVSMLVPEIYQAECVAFAYSPKTSDPRTLFQEETSAEIFGSKEDIDRMVSLGESRLLALEMMSEFKLAAHYGIDSSTTAFQTKLLKKWSKHIDIVRNDQGAVEIRVRDKDPNIAAGLANSLAERMDRHYMATIEENNAQQLVVYEDNEMQLNTQLDSLQRIMDALMTRNPKARFTRDGIVELSYVADKPMIERVQIQINRMTHDLLDATKRRSQVVSALGANTRALLVVEAARVPEVRHSPVRSLWVLIAFAASFGIMLTGCVLLSYYRAQIQQSLDAA